MDESEEELWRLLGDTELTLPLRVFLVIAFIVLFAHLKWYKQ